MKPKLRISLLLLGLLFFVQCNKNFSSSNSLHSEKDSLKYPIDLALIYHGGTQRIMWDKNQMKPYVYRMKNGQLQWLFDGFLFLEITTKMYGKTYSFVVNDNPANKALWEGLLTRTFAEGHGPGGLNQLLDSLVKKGHIPLYRRKVVISIPNPVYGNKNWGTLNNKKLDFTQDKDRIQAAIWFIDQVLKTWKDNHYSHLELAGFYWVRESVANQSSASVINAVSEYLHVKGFNFYWIPYNGAGRAGDWDTLGFDVAYQQPNYFFNLATPYSVLTDALGFAKDHNMELEMEFDGRLIDQEKYRKRFFDYLDEFKKAGVWKNRKVAYYEGGGAWLKMSQSEDTAVQRAYNTLGDILVERKR